MKTSKEWGLDYVPFVVIEQVFGNLVIDPLPSDAPEEVVKVFVAYNDLVNQYIKTCDAIIREMGLKGVPVKVLQDVTKKTIKEMTQ